MKFFFQKRVNNALKTNTIKMNIGILKNFKLHLIHLSLKFQLFSYVIFFVEICAAVIYY